MLKRHRGNIILARELAIGFVFVLLSFFLLKSGAAADQICADCHNTSSQHGGACSTDTGNCAACHGNPPADLAGLIHPFAGEPIPIASGSASAGAHAKHATSSGMNYVCSTCHFSGMSITSERLVGLMPDGSYNGNGILQIGFNIPVQGGVSFLTGGTYDGVTGQAYPYEATNGTTVNVGGTKTCSNIYCHNDGTYVSTGVLPAKTSPAWDTDSVPLTCNTCHGYPPSYGTGSPKANSHLARGHMQTCNFCHSATTTNGTTISDLPNRGNHANAVYNLSADSGALFNGVVVSFSYSYSAGGGTCSNVSCHGGTGPIVWGTLPSSLDCTACHSEIMQSGAGQNHHSTACTTCHGTTSWPLHESATPPTCQSCHPAETTLKYSMPGATCRNCHGNGGFTPVTSGTGSVCRSCHPIGSYDPYAANMHLQNPTARFGASQSGLAVNVDASASTCPTGATCSYDFDWGDGATHGTTVMGSHTYAAGTYTITLTVGSSSSVSTSTASQSVTLTQPNRAPVAAFATGTPSLSGWTATVTDASTDPDGNLSKIQVVWGDSATSSCSLAGTVTHTYTTASTYTVSLKATDTSGASSTVSAAPFTLSLGTVTGTVKKAGGVPVNMAKVTINVAGLIKTAYTNSLGAYTFTNVKPGTGYAMTATYGTTTYYNVPGGPSVTVTVNSGSNTVNFTP